MLERASGLFVYILIARIAHRDDFVRSRALDHVEAVVTIFIWLVRSERALAIAAAVFTAALAVRKMAFAFICSCSRLRTSIAGVERFVSCLYLF